MKVWVLLLLNIFQLIIGMTVKVTTYKSWYEIKVLVQLNFCWRSQFLIFPRGMTPFGQNTTKIVKIFLFKGESVQEIVPSGKQNVNKEISSKTNPYEVLIKLVKFKGRALSCFKVYYGGEKHTHTLDRSIKDIENKSKYLERTRMKSCLISRSFLPKKLIPNMVKTKSKVRLEKLLYFFIPLLFIFLFCCKFVELRSKTFSKTSFISTRTEM